MVPAEAPCAHPPTWDIQMDLNESPGFGSPILADDSEYYLVGGKVILKAWFQEEVPGLFMLDNGQDMLSAKALGRLSLDTEQLSSV